MASQVLPLLSFSAMASCSFNGGAVAGGGALAVVVFVLFAVPGVMFPAISSTNSSMGG